MSVLLSDLIARLTADVPAESGVPSSDGYSNAVKSAVADFGNRAGRVKLTTLEIVNGTASYTLPADFLKLIDLLNPTSENGVIVTSGGLVPVPLGGGLFPEIYTIAGGVITFTPTPAYTMSRYYRYKAGFALVDGSYADMSAAEAEIVLILAASIANRKKADALGGGFAYRQGDVSVDTTGQAAGLRRQVDALASDYMAAVEAYIGTVLLMGSGWC